MIDFAIDLLPGAELHRFLAEKRVQGPVVEAQLLGIPACLVTRFADVRGFLSDLDTFPAGATYEAQVEPTVGKTFISMDGTEHDRYRDLAMPAFRSRPATRFVDEELVPLAHEVIDRFAGRGEADLVAEFTGVLPFWSISRKVGLPLGTEEQQRRWALAMLSYPGSPDAALAASTEVTAFLEPVVEDRRAKPKDDVLSHLLQQGMTDDEVISHVRLLYAVGATTTSDAMSNLFWALLGRRDLCERAHDDPASRPWIVNELLRWEPPVAVLPRIATSGGAIAGVDVPAGTVVLAAIAAANRDPDVFDDPDTFDPDRRQRDQVTFGSGAKFCPGSHLANRQLCAALDVVCSRLPGLRLVDADEPTGSILRSCKRLIVEWD